MKEKESVLSKNFPKKLKAKKQQRLVSGTTRHKDRGRFATGFQVRT